MVYFSTVVAAKSKQKTWKQVNSCRQGALSGGVPLKHPGQPWKASQPRPQQLLQMDEEPHRYGDPHPPSEHAVGVWVPRGRTQCGAVAGLPGRRAVQRSSSQPLAMPCPPVQKATENLQGPGSVIG